MSDPLVTPRPPRIQPNLPTGQIEIPAPPQHAHNTIAQIAQLGLPLATILGFVVVATIGGNGQSPLLLIPMLISVLAALTISLLSFFHERRERRESERSYAARLAELNTELRASHDAQRRFFQHAYPDIASALALVERARASAERAATDEGCHESTRLWERRTEDDDFGMISIGVGTRPSTVIYTLNRTETDDSPLLREARRIASSSRYVSDTPITLGLRPPRQPDERSAPQPGGKSNAQERRVQDLAPCPCSHALAIAGERATVYAYTRSLLAQTVTFHAASDMRLYILGSDQRPWGWADDLPHVRPTEGRERQTLFMQGDAPDYDEDEGSALERFLEPLRRTLAQRKLRLQENEEQTDTSDPTLPQLLLLVDLLDADKEDSPLQDVAADAGITILIEEGAKLGAAVIFLVSRRTQVPGGCTAVIEVERTLPLTNTATPDASVLTFRYTETGINSFRYVGQADEVASPVALVEFARALGSLSLRQSNGAGVASNVSFLKLMGYETLRDLEIDSERQWTSSVTPQRARWLQARLGMVAGNKPRVLRFAANRDGVHGIVAGSTGSGKSELLISLITGMAVTYDPSVLNFVLVDYKGGGTFEAFRTLPHCVDIITNLNGGGVTRMFTAIMAEMKRRQKLNSDTSTKNIVEYRAKGNHLSREPYPFLFIIIDEFAEMIAERPEYRAQLESITRLGRAQGISLLLAAQRPSGVTDQMRSNIKFRICLRVETPGESRELLRRGEAAFLPGIPGRGYLQIGNEEIELIQAAYAGDPYREEQSSSTAVRWLARERARAAANDVPPPELFKVVIARLCDLAARQSTERQLAPWAGFLPEQLTLTEPLLADQPGAQAVTFAKYLKETERITLGRQHTGTLTLNPALNRWLNGKSGWIAQPDWEHVVARPVIGLVDDPAGARQVPLIADLPHGHLLVAGMSGAGKTALLRTLLLSLVASHSPNHLHAYVVDLGGRSFDALRGLPHIGAVITPDDAGFVERVAQLMRELEELVEHRKVLLTDANASTLVEYNRGAKRPVPAIVVVIDGFMLFNELFGGDPSDADTIQARLLRLARQCRPYGLHLIITAQDTAKMPLPLLNSFTERMVLRLADPSEYRELLGAPAPDIGDVAGRGAMIIDQEPLVFQAALPLDLRRADAQAANERREIERLAGLMRREIERNPDAYTLPFHVDPLPTAVRFRQIVQLPDGAQNDATLSDRLAELMRQQWADSLDPAQADWLKVALGVVAGGRTRMLHLEAKRDGVHALVAGGTGAGKSELLMTLIVSLALNYDPSVLNFVLVDYKGGGAFRPFEQLPHCVDIVTNLNKAAVRRMFTAIVAEMERRQHLNTATGTKDIVEYREKGLHLTHAPYPHLVIIIDEYAELISSSPEFIDELESITRLGRAQGVNLILASQRPTGVSDQMRANIKLRICLRVEEADTSRELLRRPDAAQLPNGMPGRGYVQVGNAAIELIQVAWTGEPVEDAPVLENGEAPRLFDAVVSQANAVLKAQSRIRPLAPWPPFLPQDLAFNTALSPAYLNPEDRERFTLAPNAVPAVNPAIAAWLAGDGTWRASAGYQDTMRAVVGIVDDPGRALTRPLLIDLARGNAVIFGASGWGKTTLIRSLITSLAATHSPDAFHAHILDLGGRSLESLKALPHVGTVIMPDDPGYAERIQQLWRELNVLIDRRKRLFSTAGVTTIAEYNQTGAPPEPSILVAIDNIAELIESFGKQSDGDDPTNPLDAFVGLARLGRAYGIHFIITATRLNLLSAKLYSLFTERLTLRMASADDYSGVVGGTLREIDEIAGRGAVAAGRTPLSFQVARVPLLSRMPGGNTTETEGIRQIGAAMDSALAADPHEYHQPLRIDALPTGASYRHMLARWFEIQSTDEQFLPALRAAVEQRWADNAEAQHAAWLRAPFAVMSGNSDRVLELEAKRDGVHAIIAGGTGSGKSEALMTLIVGLALNYSPDILNFVLVDYKGGGAFAPFAQLPHCVDLVTNLNKSAVQRMFIAINAEIRRRQALNAETGTKDIVEYRSRGLHISYAAYPHLFIIVDEYAEMIDDNEDSRGQLESITRVGRAQGVNLILASQRPKGVTDQMRANIKLRICLRVEDTDTSRELLGRPDAALLPNGTPGRGYIQVGNDNAQLVQVGFSGDRVALQTPDPAEPDEADQQRPKLFALAVRMAYELYGSRMALRPWPNFLPNSFSLETQIADVKDGGTFCLEPALAGWAAGTDTWPQAGAPIRPIIGLRDDPEEAKQVPHAVELSRGHLVAFGDAGSGKTALLRTLGLSLAATYPPEALHLYIIDLGGRSFRSLEALPHVGAAIYSDDETFDERLHRLLDQLDQTIAARQQRFSEADCTAFGEYNLRHPKQALPAIVVLIDNFAELQENYEPLVEGVLLPLVRRALSVGISFAITANTPSNLPGKLGALFAERLTFKQANSDRYMDILGRKVVEPDALPGRGFVLVDRRPLQLQAALPIGVAAIGAVPTAESDTIRQIGAQMWKLVTSPADLPTPVNTLPTDLPLNAVLQESAAPLTHAAAVLGRNERLAPALFDLRRLGPHFTIIGSPLSGKTTTLRAWALALTYQYAPTQLEIVLIDLQRQLFDYGGDRSLRELPHVSAAISEIPELGKFVDQLEARCAALPEGGSEQRIVILIDNFDELSEELERERELEYRLAGLVRRYGRNGLHVVISASTEAGISDLRRRVQASNYGLGLRAASAVEQLRVMRVPAGLEAHELPIGRGYMVKSGQATLVQIANPYAHPDLPARPVADPNDLVAPALDHWVTTILGRFPDLPPRASRPQPIDNPTALSAAELERRTDLQRLLRAIMGQELAPLGQSSAPIAHALLELEKELPLERIRELLRTVWRRQREREGIDADLLNLIAADMDDDALLMELAIVFELAPA